MSFSEKVLQLKQDFDDVLEAGRKAEYDKFWDNYQNYGKRTYYFYAFATEHWNENTFKPKYDIQPTDAQGMFSSNYSRFDLVEHLNSLGITLDFSKCKTFNSVFNGSQFIRIGVIDMSSCTETNLYYCFRNSFIQTIDEWVVPSTPTTFTGVFQGASKLENINVSGTIKVNGLDLSACPLTHESIMSFVNALADTGGTTKTIKFGATNLAKLNDSEKAIATQKGWTIT